MGIMFGTYKIDFESKPNIWNPSSQYLYSIILAIVQFRLGHEHSYRKCQTKPRIKYCMEAFGPVGRSGQGTKACMKHN